jgi:hypothetical protein
VVAAGIARLVCGGESCGSARGSFGLGGDECRLRLGRLGPRHGGMGPELVELRFYLREGVGDRPGRR